MTVPVFMSVPFRGGQQRWRRRSARGGSEEESSLHHGQHGIQIVTAAVMSELTPDTGQTTSCPYGHRAALKCEWNLVPVSCYPLFGGV